MAYTLPQVVSAEEAVACVEYGMTLAINTMPAGSFGASVNPIYMTDMSTMFDFYDGGILDMVCVGAAQIDSKGNVNVGKIGTRTFGVGGGNLTISHPKNSSAVIRFTFQP